MRRKYIGIVAIMVLAAAGVARAQGMEGMHDQQKGMMQQNMHAMKDKMHGSGSSMTPMKSSMGFHFFLNVADKLGLNDEQKSKLRSNKFAFEKEEIKRKANLKTAQLELQQLKMDENAESTEIESKIREIYTIKAERDIALLRAKKDARSVLTATQLKKLDGMMCPMCGQMHGMEGGKMMQGSMMDKKSGKDESPSHDEHH